MIKHKDINDRELHGRIRRGEISLGGNEKLKIYGKLHCASGKRMKRNIRVFFQSEVEAKEKGYRPCGHCMKDEFSKWKKNLIGVSLDLLK